MLLFSHLVPLKRVPFRFDLGLHGNTQGQRRIRDKSCITQPAFFSRKLLVYGLGGKWGQSAKMGQIFFFIRPWNRVINRKRNCLSSVWRSNYLSSSLTYIFPPRESSPSFFLEISFWDVLPRRLLPNRPLADSEIQGRSLFLGKQSVKRHNGSFLRDRTSRKHGVSDDFLVGFCFSPVENFNPSGFDYQSRLIFIFTWRPWFLKSQQCSAHILKVWRNAYVDSSILDKGSFPCH